MNTFVVLMRGINVGGKNKVSMTDLKQYLGDLGYESVVSHINSGNLVIKTSKSANEVRKTVEDLLPKHFKLDSELIKALVLSSTQLKAVVDNKPQGFGNQPDKYYSDAIFLIDFDEDEALKVFDPREGIDKVWKGNGVIYSQRLGAERTKSRLGKIIGTKPYQSMTIRSWNTVTKLLALAND